MAESATAYLAAALCFLALLGAAQCHPLTVQGQVFCDPCRVRFLTRISEYMEGAKVRLECRNREGGDLTYSLEGVTNSTGHYQLSVEGEHEEEVCEVVPVKSRRDDCSQLPANMGAGKAKYSARISLTHDNGIASPVRLANPLGFFQNTPSTECVAVLKELGILPHANAHGFPSIPNAF